MRFFLALLIVWIGLVGCAPSDSITRPQSLASVPGDGEAVQGEDFLGIELRCSGFSGESRLDVLIQTKEEKTYARVWVSSEGTTLRVPPFLVAKQGQLYTSGGFHLEEKAEGLYNASIVIDDVPYQPEMECSL